MKPIKFGTSDETYYKLKSIAADRYMSVIELMGYVIGTFLWVVDNLSKGNKVIAVSAEGEVLKKLDVWGDEDDEKETS